MDSYPCEGLGLLTPSTHFQALSAQKSFLRKHCIQVPRSWLGAHFVPLGGRKSHVPLHVNVHEPVHESNAAISIFGGAICQWSRLFKSPCCPCRCWCCLCHCAGGHDSPTPNCSQSNDPQVSPSDTNVLNHWSRDVAQRYAFTPTTSVPRSLDADNRPCFFLACSPERNIIEAASSGAQVAISLVANIAANLIAFIALKEFLNATLTWAGERVGIYDPPLTFEVSTKPHRLNFIALHIRFQFLGISLSCSRQVNSYSNESAHIYMCMFSRCLLASKRIEKQITDQRNEVKSVVRVQGVKSISVNVIKCKWRKLPRAVFKTDLDFRCWNVQLHELDQESETQVRPIFAAVVSATQCPVTYVETTTP